MEDPRPLFFDPNVLLDKPPTESPPQYPGQTGLAPTATAAPLVYAPRKKRENKNRFSAKHVRQSTPRVKGRLDDFRVTDQPGTSASTFPRYIFPQGGPALPARPGQEDAEPTRPVNPLPDPAPVDSVGPAQDAGSATGAGGQPRGSTQAATGAREEVVEPGAQEGASSALPTSMTPPPAFHEIFTSQAVQAPGDGFFQAVATSMILQTHTHGKAFPKRERNNMAKQYRAMAYNTAIGLTFGEQAKSIFAFQEEETERFDKEIRTIREMLQSFIDKPTQQAVPAKFGEDWDYILLMLPRFLAHALQKPIYIYASQDGIQGNLLRFRGFAPAGDDLNEGDPVMVLHRTMVYEAVQWHQEYQDFLPTLEGRIDKDASMIQPDEINQCLAVVHYMYSFSAQREYI